MARFTPYKVYLDPVEGPLHLPNGECPNAAEHTPSPLLTLHWHEWVEEMAKTHVQRQCDGCKLFVIWTPLALSLSVLTEEG